MSVLSTLPTEILRQIFSCLPRVDLVNSCLVSHRVYTITSCFLYTEVIVSASTIHLFARTILASEELANYVTNLRSTWPRSGSHQWHAVQVSLLLHLLPNLDILDCTPPQRGAQDILEFLDIFYVSRFYDGQVSDMLPAGLRSVTEIWNGNDENDEECVECVSRTAFLAMMMLPSIRKIQAYTDGFEQSANINHQLASYAGRSLVTHLHLLEYYTSLPALQRLLHVPQALTHFSYRYICHDIVSIDCTHFGIVISHLRETLQSLALDFAEGLRTTDEGIAAAHRTIGSLRDWPVLTYVRSSLQPLLGMLNAPETLRLGDVLPVAIKTLAIDQDMIWDTPATLAAIVDLVENKATYGLTRLATIENPHRYFPARDFCKALGELCDAAGIVFRVVGSDWVTEVVYSE